MRKIKTKPLPKDFIFQSQNPKNPLCLLASGNYKLYSALNAYDNVFVKENGKFIEGSIVSMTHYSKEEGWIYIIKTKYSQKRRKPSEFKGK